LAESRGSGSEPGRLLQLDRLIPKLWESSSPSVTAALRIAVKVVNRQKRRLAVVGGVVRDLLLQKSVFDVDVMSESPTRSLAREVAEELHAELVEHDRFLTFTIHLEGGLKLDVVTARQESYGAPGQLPVVAPAPIEMDLKRRDFTVNSIAVFLDSSNEGRLLDPFGGIDDLRSRKIRALHDQSFVDDPTRIFRAARFAGRFSFDVDPKTQKQIEGSIGKGYPRLLSPARRRHEFELVLREVDPGPALRLLESWGVLAVIHQDWALRPEHLEALRRVDRKDLEGRLACWFRPWGPAAAQKMMTELGFERATKKAVHDALAGK